MSSLWELTIPLLFIHNFCWINFPPADFTLGRWRSHGPFQAFLSVSLPSVSMGSPKLVKQSEALSVCYQQGKPSRVMLTSCGAHVLGSPCSPCTHLSAEPLRECLRWWRRLPKRATSQGCRVLTEKKENSTDLGQRDQTMEQKPGSRCIKHR